MMKEFATRSPSVSDLDRSFCAPSRRRWLRRVIAAAAAACASVVAGAHAEGAVDKEACFRAYEQAQRFRKVTKLVEARAELVVCQETCPATLGADCAQWLDDNDRRVPTLLVDAEDAAGHPVSAVRVVADEQLLALHIDDRPIPVDPGEHQLRFESESGLAVVQRIVVREGEKGRRIAVRFDKPAAPAVAVSAPPVTVQPPTTASTLTSSSATVAATDRPFFTKMPLGAYVGAGVGVLGLLGFAVFGSERANLESRLDGCKPNCPSSQSSDANGALFVLTDGSLLLGLGGVAIAAYFYFVRPKPAKAGAAESSPTVGIGAVPGGARVTGTF
jgi:hypothetical protein